MGIGMLSIALNNSAVDIKQTKETIQEEVVVIDTEKHLAQSASLFDVKQKTAT